LTIRLLQYICEALEGFSLVKRRHWGRWKRKLNAADRILSLPPLGTMLLGRLFHEVELKSGAM
jgi:hypothetical protein